MATAQSPGKSKISTAIPTSDYEEFLKICERLQEKPAAVIRKLIAEFNNGSIKLSLNPAIKDSYK